MPYVPQSATPAPPNDPYLVHVDATHGIDYHGGIVVYWPMTVYLIMCEPDTTSCPHCPHYQHSSDLQGTGDVMESAVAPWAGLEVSRLSPVRLVESFAAHPSDACCSDWAEWPDVHGMEIQRRKLLTITFDGTDLLLQVWRLVGSTKSCAAAGELHQPPQWVRLAECVYNI